MKKACLSILFFLTLFSFLHLNTSPVFAQNCGLVGPKIAGNIDPSNYAQIREQYDQYGCAGYSIPVTIIYSTADLGLQNRQTLLQNLQAMKRYNLIPIIRVSSEYFSPSDGWIRITPQKAQIAGESLTWALSQIQFSEPVNVYFGNEPDLAYEWGGSANAESFANSFAAFILGAGISDRDFNILMPPMATHTGQVDFPFLDTVLNTMVTGNLTIADLVDGAALTIYGENAQAVSDQYQKLFDFMVKKGIPNNFIITELGPLYHGGLLQDREDVNRWVQTMESIIQEFMANHDLFPDVQFITTSFFLDLDGDGHPDITLLVIITADGKIIILELSTFGGGIIYMYGDGAFGGGCTPSEGGDPDSQPIPCDACILEPPLTYSCASTFAVHNTVSWKWKDSNFICEPTGEHWVERDWGGDIIIDPSQVKVPFVGKKGEEDVEKYLADYFEGTAFYYGPDIDLSDCKKENPNEVEQEACQEAVERVVAEGGVFRKLAPKEWQDELKKEMIERAQKSLAGNIQEGTEIIHDYLIEHGGISMSLSQINPPPKPPEDLETEAAYQNWVGRYDNWRESDSGKLWAAVPMFTREDSPGQVIASVNTKRKDTVAVIPPVQVEKVPHLARLFEVTRELQNLLLPWLKEGEAKASAKTLLASSNPQVLGEKTLLAQGGTGPCVDSRGYVCTYDPSEGGCQWGWCASMEIQGICCSGKNCTVRTALADAGHMDVHINGTEIATQRPRGKYDWQIGSPGPNQRVCTNVTLINRDIGIPGGQYTESGGCCIDLDEDGVGCCGQLGPPINEPKCGLPEPVPYPACEYESITDENPNDTICCDPVLIDLKAVEQFENPNYTGPCIWFTDPATGERDLLNPDCKNTETRLVHRDVKVDLFHPYLKEIWGQTTDSFRGLFNIFRPKIEAPFEDLEAHSYIEYTYGGGSITPEEPWKFYFPHLGGVQKAKEWVLKTLNSGEAKEKNK